jgi:hypothetical protein
MLWSWLSTLRSAAGRPSPRSLRGLGRRHAHSSLSGTRFRPTVVALEDRTVPSGGAGPLGSGAPPSIFPTAGPATHLQVIAPGTVVAGQTFKVLVVAETASNLPDPGFSDTVVLSSSDPKALGDDNGPQVGPGPATLTPLPLTYTFNPTIDHGFHVFLVNLSTLGPQKITATDSTDSTVTPSTAITTVTPAPTLAKLLVVMPKSTTVGTPTPVSIAALDASGHLISNFTDTVNLSTSDPLAKGLPSSYTFNPTIDHGFHTFQVTFGTVNIGGPTATSSAPVPTTVTATDGSITGTGSIWVFPPSTVARFAVFALRPVVEGVATPVIVVALNAANQIIPGYAGTVTLASSDPNATASATAGGTQTPLSSFTYMFGATDGGLHVFYVTFGSSGKQTLTVSDASAGVKNTIDVYVLMALAPKHSWFLF